MKNSIPVFFRAPHRVMFMAGATQGMLALAWWAVELAGRQAGLYAAPAWPLPPAWLHGALMMFGFFPYFIFGFLMTAMPRWVGAPSVRAWSYVASFAFMSAGWLAFYVSLGLPRLMAPALALAVVGWIAGLLELARVLRHPAGDKRHARIVVAAQTVGAVCLAAFAAYAAGGAPVLGRGALTGGVWFYLLPVFATVVHRMLPFFSGSVIPNYRGGRPFWALYALLACFVAHGVLVLADAARWTWLVDLPAAGIAFHLSWLWQLPRSFVMRMLAVLHVAFLWLGIALALFGAQSAAALAGYGVLGLAPLHALTIGFFASLLLGMTSRVTLGHSGRSIAADAWTWVIFWGMQSVAVVRVAAEFIHVPGAANLSLLAAIGWLVFYGWWYAKYAPSYVARRPDGQPG